MTTAVDKLTCLSWNQTKECFAAGSEKGFVIVNVSPFKEIARRDIGGIGRIKMYYRTNFVVLVGGGRNPAAPSNKVLIWDDAKQSVKFEIEFKTPVLNIEVTRQRLVVVLFQSIFVYAWAGNDTPPLLLDAFSYTTADNTSGTIALFANESTSLVAFPAKQLGYVHVVDITNPTPNETISVLFPAHKHDVSSITFSSTGQYIATASTQGTLIRIFSTRKGKQLTEFRRSRVPATICAVAFNARDTRLAVISSTGTLHVFSLASASSSAAPSATSTVSQWFGTAAITSDMEFPTPMCDLALTSFGIVSPQSIASSPDLAGQGAMCVMAVCDNCSFYAFAFSDRGPIGSRPDLPYQFSRFYKIELSALARLFPIVQKPLTRASHKIQQPQTQPQIPEEIEQAAQAT